MRNLEDMVRRDRNHPSVIAYSLGNEAEGAQRTQLGAQVAAAMIVAIHHFDPTRAVTYADSSGGNDKGISEVIDVRGWNYQPETIDGYHQAHPGQPTLGTEQGSYRSTRGIYEDNPQNKEIGYAWAYAIDPSSKKFTLGWWKTFADTPWLSGAFIWSGFDYRGEPSPKGWPCVNSNYGLLDLCGFRKDIAYYFKAWWSDEPTIHILPHWNWPGRVGQSISIQCFSNAEEVELFQDGKSLGRKPMPPCGDVRWDVTYNPGKLEAVGYRDGHEVARDTVETTGPAAAIKLAPHWPSMRANGRDVAVVDVLAVDGQGRVVPDANLAVDFTLDGPGKIRGAGDGDPACHEQESFVDKVNCDAPEPIAGWQSKTLSTRERDWWDSWTNYIPSLDVLDAPAAAQADWAATDITGSTWTQPAKTIMAYRTSFPVDANSLKAGRTLLELGSYHQEVALFLNGRYVWTGFHFTDGKSPPKTGLDVTGSLRAGNNDMVVLVSAAKDMQGGLQGGVQLIHQTLEVTRHAQHSIFNGRGQIILQAGTDPGTVTLQAGANGLQAGFASIPINAPPLGPGADDVAPEVMTATPLAR